MPQVENLGANVEEFCDRTGNGSSKFFVCVGCYRDLEDDPHAYDTELEPYNGDPDGEDGRGGDVDTPPIFLDDPPGTYRCEVCDEVLTESNFYLDY